MGNKTNEEVLKERNEHWRLIEANQKRNIELFVQILRQNILTPYLEEGETKGMEGRW